MWCDAVFCAPRCRDLGRGFDLAEMLELVRNFRPCRRGSPECVAFLPRDLWDLKWVKTINRCMSYMCHICAMYTYTMSIYDHMKSHDAFASDANWNSEIPLASNPRNCEISPIFPCNFRAWGRAWPRALLSLQRRSIRSTCQRIPRQDIQDIQDRKAERQKGKTYHPRTWEIDNAQCCHLAISCHCSLTSCQSGVSKCLSLTQSCEIFSVSISSSSKKHSFLFTSVFWSEFLKLPQGKLS